MNYNKIYSELINKAKLENRVRNKDIYYEKHHIIPKCMNGSNDNDNLVLLTGREHFIAHMLLYNIYPDNQKIAYALLGMTIKSKKQNREYKISARIYEELRKNLKHSTETKKKISKNTVGENNPMYGKKQSDETKKKISEANKGRKQSEETKKKKSKAHLGKRRKPFTEEHKQNLKEAWKTRPPVTEETRKKMSISSKKAAKTENRKKQWLDCLSKNTKINQ